MALLRGCGRSSLTLAARREDPGTCEEDPEEQSAQPGRRDVATGPDLYALLTVVALMGVALRDVSMQQRPAGSDYGHEVVSMSA